MFERYGFVRRVRARMRPRRLASRRCRPGVDGLEARELLHAGPAVGHVAAAVKSLPQPAPAIPVATIQNALAVSYANGTTWSQPIQTRDATILIPPGLVPGKTYPLVVAFAYNGNPIIPFEVWWTQATQNHWIIYASKDFKNSVLTSGLASSNAVAARVKAQLDTITTILPVDPSRIILTGMSGGANYAEFMNLRYPGYAAGIIINSGRIPAQLIRPTPTPGFLTMPTASDFAGSRREAVFLASPTDTQFYGITQVNARTMEGLGWDTLFLSFPGGHWNAPPATYNKAISWILSQPSWSAGT